jgi:hypothetical protein
MTELKESLTNFFRSKRRQLLAAATEANTAHAGLLGSHREALVRDFLGPLLPRRFSVGRGMVFGIAHRSREADLVVWDSDNYPCIPFSQHAHFFAEAVRVVLEAKSRYSNHELNDMLAKCKSVRDIVPMQRLNIADEIAMLQLDIASLREGVSHSGMLITGHHIASAGLFFFGGESFSLEELDADIASDIDDAWPDILLFLNAGVVVAKNYEWTETGFGEGHLHLVRAGEDSLMLFAAGLLTLINDRSVQVEDPSFLEVHIGLQEQSSWSAEHRVFELTRPVAARVPLWSKTRI